MGGRWKLVLAVFIASVSLFGCPAPDTPEGAAAQDTVPPSIPSALTATAVSTSQIDLTWLPSTDNVAVAGYVVYRNGTSIARLGSVTAYQDTGLTPSTTYSYTVLASDAAGNASAQSIAANAMTLAPDTTPPSTPSGLTATAISTSRIDLNWAASTDNVAVTGYQVYRGGTLLVTLGKVTNYQNTGLSPNTSYSYTVLAFDAAGNNSPQSAAAGATTMAPDTTPPSVPAGLAATPISGSQINLIWTAATDNVAVTGYKVYRDGALSATLGNTTSFQATGLAPGTSYSFAVSAIDGAGNESVQSTSVTASTLLATASVTLLWDAVTDARLSGYRIYFSNTNQNNYQAPGQGLDVGNVTTYTVTGLLSGTRYYFKATAYDTSNIESTYSNEIFTDIP